MANRSQKTDEEKGDELLRRLLKTPPEQKAGKEASPGPQGLFADAKPLDKLTR